MFLRLSVFMFLLYAPLGAILPLYVLHLEHLEFTPRQIGMILATQPIATLISCLWIGQLADRWVPVQYCIAFCAAVAGVLLWVLAGLTRPGPVLVTNLAYWLVMGPALTCSTSLSFVHLPTAAQNFGRVRLWGTVGWMTAIWVLSLLLQNPAWLTQYLAKLRPEQPTYTLADSFRLASVLSVGLAVYALLLLPHTPPQKSSTAPFAPLAALTLFRQPALAICLLCTLCMSMTLPFHAQCLPLLLKQLGIEEAWIGRTLTIAQISEILALGILAYSFRTLLVRNTMLVGIGTWCFVLCLLVLGRPLGLMVSSLIYNGFCISFFFVAGQVYINSLAQGNLRTSTQSLLTSMNATGQMLGSLLAGVVRAHFHNDLASTLAVGLGIASVALVTFFVGFTEYQAQPGTWPSSERQAT